MLQPFKNRPNTFLPCRQFQRFVFIFQDKSLHGVEILIMFATDIFFAPCILTDCCISLLIGERGIILWQWSTFLRFCMSVCADPVDLKTITLLLLVIIIYIIIDLAHLLFLWNGKLSFEFYYRNDYGFVNVGHCYKQCKHLLISP